MSKRVCASHHYYSSEINDNKRFKSNFEHFSGHGQYFPQVSNSRNFSANYPDNSQFIPSYYYPMTSSSSYDYSSRDRHEFGSRTSQTSKESRKDSHSIPTRTIYLGGLPESTTFEEIFLLCHHGVIDACRMLPEKNAAFIDFVDIKSAISFYDEYNSITSFGSRPKIATIKKVPIKVAYANSNPLLPSTKFAADSGSTRILYLSGLSETPNSDGVYMLNEPWLKTRFSKYGFVETVRTIKEKRTAFIYFISIVDAVKAYFQVNEDPLFKDVKVGYGKERGSEAAPFKLQEAHHPYSTHVLPSSSTAAGPMDPYSYPYDNIPPPGKVKPGLPYSTAPTSTQSYYHPSTNHLPPPSIPHTNQDHYEMHYPPTAPNDYYLKSLLPEVFELTHLPGVPRPFTEDHRNIFLGGLHWSTTLKHITSAIHCGPLFKIKLHTYPTSNTSNGLSYKYAFATFVYASDALKFYYSIVGFNAIISKNERNTTDSSTTATTDDDSYGTNINKNIPGIIIDDKKIFKVGFAKPVTINRNVLNSIEVSNASRNIYLSRKREDQSFPSHDKIYSDFKEFGEIENVKYIHEKSCAFVNFVDVVSSLKAIGVMSIHKDYAGYKMVFSKDPCSLPPKTASMAENSNTEDKNHFTDNENECIIKDYRHKRKFKGSRTKKYRKNGKVHETSSLKEETNPIIQENGGEVETSENETYIETPDLDLELCEFLPSSIHESSELLDNPNLLNLVEHDFSNDDDTIEDIFETMQ